MSIDSENKVNKPSSGPKGREKGKPEAQQSAEVKDAVRGSDSAVYEAVIAPEVAGEAAAETTGRVSEILTEDREVKGDGDGRGAVGDAKTKSDPASIRAQLVKSMPTERKEVESMVRAEIKKEIKYLRKRAMKMMRNPTEVSYFEMNNLLRKIRELRGILSALVKASLERLKTLWLRFVHGIM